MIDDNDFTSSNPISTPSPTSTPTPGSAPIDYQTATTYRIDNSDGSYSIFGKLSGKELYCVKADGTFTILGDNYSNAESINKGVDSFDISKLSFDDQKGLITINNNDGKPIIVIKTNSETVDKYDYWEFGTDIDKYDYNGYPAGKETHTNDGEICIYDRSNVLIKKIYSDGKYEIYDDNFITQYDSHNNKVKKIFTDGSYEIYEKDKTIIYDASSDTYSYLYSDGTLINVLYDDEGKEYLHIYQNGKKVYLKNNLILYSDGTYECKGITGTYDIDLDGNIRCVDNKNNTYLYNNVGLILEKKNNIGDITRYDYNNMAEMVIRNGVVSVYSRINHIEYDEEEYHHILETFNNISNSDYASINTLCSDIDNKIQSFPDSYSGGMVSEIGKSIKSNIDLIGSLGEMTNYSLLAYEACDNSLKDKLNSLIDSLFDSKEGGEGFKKLISSLIEDRDNDGILEYKLNTDFDYVYNNLIPTQKYVDEDGNILYFNNLGNFLTADGNNIKINYGGEDFTITFGENGCAILRDSKGNPINIFGDYNLPSKQYGGNQGDFINNISNLLKDDNINAILDKYFPNATYEEKTDYLINIAFQGCGFVTMTNLVFDRMEGYEEDFQNKFGYSMYDLIYQDGNVSVNYNYEPLTLELCSEYFGKDIDGNAKPISESSVSGMSDLEEFETELYLINKYNIYDYNKDKPFTKLSAQSNYILYDMDGNKSVNEGLSGHAMTLVEKTEDGKMYASNWGSKYYIEIMPGGHVYEREYPLPDFDGYVTSVYKGVYGNYYVKYITVDGKKELLIKKDD